MPCMCFNIYKYCTIVSDLPSLSNDICVKEAHVKDFDDNPWDINDLTDFYVFYYALSFLFTF